MPVEDIELAHLHQVQVVPDHRLCNVVSARVHQDASVCESWRVHYLGSVDNILKILVLVYNFTIEHMWRQRHTRDNTFLVWDKRELFIIEVCVNYIIYASILQL